MLSPDRGPSPCSRPISKLIAEIERNHEDAVLLVFARQEGRVIEFRVAQVDIFEGPADVHAFVPLVLSANGIADLPVPRQISRPVAVRDGRGIVGDALPLLKFDPASESRVPAAIGVLRPHGLDSRIVAVGANWETAYGGWLQEAI